MLPPENEVHAALMALVGISERSMSAVNNSALSDRNRVPMM